MPKSVSSVKSEDLSSTERLCQAAIDSWERPGNGAVSARLLGQAADAPVSGIYHYFGSLERLFLAAHERALALAGEWCTARLSECSELAMISQDDFPALFAALIDDWCEDNRGLAFAWRECELMAMRDPLYLPALRGWEALWRSFWDDICARCGHAGRGMLTSYLFCSESLLHLMRWQRVPDRACLDEITNGWGRWLGGALAPDGGWRSRARAQAAVDMPDIVIQAGATEQIATAAAAVLAKQGVAGLTHRAVAAHAGVTLGVVSYNFRSSTELVRAAFEIIYRQTVRAGGSSMVDLSYLSEGELTERYVEHLRIAPTASALDELLIAVARNPDLRGFAPQLRYWRGRSSRQLLLTMIGPQDSASALDAALLSGILAGLRKMYIGRDPKQASALTRECLDAVGSLIAHSS